MVSVPRPIQAATFTSNNVARLTDSYGNQIGCVTFVRYDENTVVGVTTIQALAGLPRGSDAFYVCFSENPDRFWETWDHISYDYVRRVSARDVLLKGYVVGNPTGGFTSDMVFISLYDETKIPDGIPLYREDLGNNQPVDMIGFNGPHDPDFGPTTAVCEAMNNVAGVKCISSAKVCKVEHNKLSHSNFTTMLSRGSALLINGCVVGIQLYDQTARLLVNRCEKPHTHEYETYPGNAF